MDTSFIRSNRFWALILTAMVIYLGSKGIIGESEKVLLETILGGFIAVRTVDRFAEKIG